MKIAFWNIGKNFNKNKAVILKDFLLDKEPNILCIAEGSNSQLECEELEILLLNSGYEQYYSPILGKTSYKENYIRNGLKVYHKNCYLAEKFDFIHSRQNGRIIRLMYKHDNKIFTIIFLHNFSKSGNRESTLEQVSFITTLNQMITNGNHDNKNSNIVIIGDFNIEPWDNILRNPKLVNSFFLNKHLVFEKEKKNNNALMFNPLIENLIVNNNKIGGTYFSKKMGWALYDYPIFNENVIDLEYKIISNLNGVEILNDENTDFDHLPIIIKIK